VFPVLIGPKGRLRPRALVALALVCVLTLLSGCGGGTVVESEDLEATIKTSLEKSNSEKIKKVECPSDVSVDPGTTFTCTVIFSDDRREEATLKIRNKDADLSMVGLKPTK
jgi:Domain of unknown function (DUF4333)